METASTATKSRTRSLNECFGDATEDNSSWNEHHKKYGGHTHSEQLKGVVEPKAPDGKKAAQRVMFFRNGVVGRHGFRYRAKRQTQDKNLEKGNAGAKDADKSVVPEKVSGKENSHHTQEPKEGSSKRNDQSSSEIKCDAEIGENKVNQVESKDDRTITQSEENLTDKPPVGHIMRPRATSDFGIGSCEKDQNDTPRTSALLRQPSFRKHLSKLMRTKTPAENLQDTASLEIAFKLASASNLAKLKNASEENLHMTTETNENNLSASLRAAQSEQNLRSQSAETSPRESQAFSHWEVVPPKVQDNSDSEGEPPLLMRSFSGPGTVAGDRKRFSLRSSGKFRIPSFSEFKKMRAKGGLLPDKMKFIRMPIAEEMGQTSHLRTDSHLSKSDLDRSRSFSQDSGENSRQLKRTNTDPDIGRSVAQGQSEQSEITECKHCRRARNTKSSVHQPPKSKDRKGESLISAWKKVQRKGRDRERNRRGSFTELDSWKQSVMDSEKGSDSDDCPCSSDSEQGNRHRTHNLRNRTTSSGRGETDLSAAVNSTSGQDEDTDGSSVLESHCEPTGRPPLAPKGSRRKLDWRNPGRRRRGETCVDLSVCLFWCSRMIHASPRKCKRNSAFLSSVCSDENEVHSLEHLSSSQHIDNSDEQVCEHSETRFCASF